MLNELFCNARYHFFVADLRGQAVGKWATVSLELFLLDAGIAVLAIAGDVIENIINSILHLHTNMALRSNTRITQRILTPRTDRPLPALDTRLLSLYRWILLLLFPCPWQQLLTPRIILFLRFLLIK